MQISFKMLDMCKNNRCFLFYNNIFNIYYAIYTLDVYKIYTYSYGFPLNVKLWFFQSNDTIVKGTINANKTKEDLHKSFIKYNIIK